MMMDTLDPDTRTAPDERLGSDGGEAARARIGTREHVRHTLVGARGHALLARAAALADRGERAVQQSLALRAQLRASVTAYVRGLRADQLPSERVLVLVKSAVREATPPDLGPGDARDLMEDVVRWSIDAYYHAA